MNDLANQRVLVTGGSRGLGRAIVEALAERGARVTVLARDSDALAAVGKEIGAETIAADATDPAVAASVLGRLRPEITILSAGAVPEMAPLHELSWEAFSRTWNVDTQATFHWFRAALTLPLPPGSRVVVVSSGAAVNGSPLSGGYAGAKRMQWLMAGYANGVAAERGLGLRFQAVLPQRMIGETRLGHAAALAYARRKGVSLEAFLEGFGEPMPPRLFAEHMTTFLTDAAYQNGLAFGFKGGGIHPLA
jgi:NAD(P)-dependent dehydrogenase (short-subunit alcohol dehydrogenase family)